VGCDLTYDYVKLNADYTSLIVETPGGGVARDDRFTNYSPKLKVALLVQALSYIGRFRGTRCVIAWHGTALANEGLLRAFCEDVLLLRSVGLVPIVVGGDETIERAVPLLNQTGAHAVGLSGKDGGMLRASGHDITVDGALVDVMLERGYVPVISPVGLGAHATSHALAPDVVAAALAAALRADKLILLGDAPGIVRDGDLVTEVDRAALDGIVHAAAIRRALEGGVSAVHVLDGRVPHSAIAELFTDSGIGTVIRA
jgi:acetylglutamate kinase